MVLWFSFILSLIESASLSAILGATHLASVSQS
jgi:hypothetical protein